MMQINVLLKSITNCDQQEVGKEEQREGKLSSESSSEVVASDIGTITDPLGVVSTKYIYICDEVLMFHSFSFINGLTRSVGPFNYFNVIQKDRLRRFFVPIVTYPVLNSCITQFHLATGNFYSIIAGTTYQLPICSPCLRILHWPLPALRVK